VLVIGILGRSLNEVVVFSRTRQVVVLLAALLLAAPGPASAASPSGSGKSATGYDISYPQCGDPFPTNVLFGIVGVNAGIVYSANPCLGTGDGPSELAWAEQYEPAAILYANTADPGPALSSHWPTGQTTPQYCDGSDSIACSYDYGWDAAADSYQDAVDAYISLGKLPAGATQTPQPNEWWLDVETANSWESNTANNVAALRGEVAYLQSQGVSSVGFYATASDWQTITGGTTVFSSYPSWHRGIGGRKTALSYCGTTGVTGGPVKYSQYRSGGFDADVRCF
jgi:hypothetical protein